MPNFARRLGIGLRLLSGLWLALAALGVSATTPPVQAAPQSGGTFTVTSALDTNNSDAVLTLREALLVARGGTGAAGLNRAASAGEQAALGGCTFAGGLITGGCGASLANSISFTGSLGLHPVITLTSSLPAITNSAATTLDGTINGVLPVVSAAAILTNTDALVIGSNNNTLAGLTITGAPHDDLRISGDSNQVLTGTVLLKAARYGLFVDGGDLNLIESVLVGTNNAAVGACTHGNQQGGIIMTNAATTNTVKLATVACNSGFGVRFDGSGTLSNTIITSTVTAQSGNGIEIVNGAGYFTAPSNTVVRSTVTSNTLDGILISGAATQGNGLFGNLVGLTASGVAAGNGQYGVRLSAGAHFNSVGNGCPVCGNNDQFISGNALGGVRLETGANDNFVAGNDIGVNPAVTAAVPNGGPGVDVDNAPNNYVGGFIGEPTLAANLIAGNSGPGVRFTNTSADVVSYFNTIGSASIGPAGLGNDGPGVELINTTNTAVVASAVCCNTGAGIAVEGASSTGNVIAPFSVSQNGGLPIDLGNDGHTPNGSHTPPGPNHWLNYPVITAASGSVITGTACLNCTIIIYIATGNPAAPGGGATYSQDATGDGAGHWRATLIGGHTRWDVTLQACTAPCSHPLIGVPSYSDTSELSPRIQMWLPAVRR